MRGLSYSFPGIPSFCRRGVGAQYVTGEVYQQRVLTPDNPDPVHNSWARGVIPE